MGKHKSEKRSRHVVSSDDEDGPDSKIQKNEGVHDDEFDNLFDEEEREKLNNMTEKDRETEIFKRIEMNQIMKTREEIKKKLEMTQKAEDKRSTTSDKAKPKPVSSSESSSSDESSEDEQGEDEESSSASSSSSAEEKSDDTAKKSKSKKSTTTRKSRKDATSDDAESDDDFDTEYHRPSELVEKSNKKKAMDVLLSKRRDKKEAEEKRKEKSQKAKYDIDEIFGDNDDDNKSGSSSSSSSRSSSPASSRGASPEPKPEITSMPELMRCRISRFRLSQHVHAPYFKDLALGCFVRVGIGSGPDGIPVYRVAQIMDIVETAKVYQVEKTRTNKGLRLKHGADERVYRLEFISNSGFSMSEFQHWIKAMKAKDLPLPTVDFIERKEADIKRFSDYTLTDSDIDSIVKEKMKFSKAPSNFAFQKGEFMKKKEYAEQCGDFHQAQELQRQIDELDTRAEELDRQRTQKLSVVTWINQRNRDHMKQSFLGANVAASVSTKTEDDPFTRKSNRMRVVSGRRTAAPTEISTDVPSNSSVLAVDNLTSNTLTSKVTSSLPSAHDLFSAHDIEIDIPINLPTNISTLRATSSSGVSDGKSITASRPAGARSISIEEYKRKRGLI